MLSGDVLADLLKPSYLTEIVVVTAWPALSVESKLQILSEMQRGRLGATPDYMLPLIVSDPEPIVRYWGLRAATLPRTEPDAYSSVPTLTPSPAQIEATRIALADEYPLVCATVHRVIGFSDPSAPHAQLARLNLDTAPPRAIHAEQILGCDLEQAVTAKSVSDADLADVIYEFLQSEEFAERSKPDEMDEDGWTHFENVGQSKRLWMLATKSGPRTANCIAWYAPMRVECEDIIQEAFPKLPPTAAAAVH